MSERVYKPKAISGFPEWLPEYRAVELAWLDKIRRVFESYGFCNIETPAVEEVDALIAAKGGDTQNEIYVLDRLYADKDEQGGKEARLALHFDLTVPMARYVAQNFNALVFPFKRYQLQKSYRGERPQKGRYREFYQCDIDIVNVDGLPEQCDSDVASALLAAYKAIEIPDVELHISDRRILYSFMQYIDHSGDEAAITRTLDKMDKIGRENVLKDLASNCGMSSEHADALISLISFKGSSIEDLKKHYAQELKKINKYDNEPIAGLIALEKVVDGISSDVRSSVVIDLGIIRGLDYYTGTVMEVRFADTKTFADLSIGGGGRYENLASAFINQKLPGVGASLGLTRLFGLLMDKGMIAPGRKCPTDVLVVLPEESRRAEAAATAHTLRQRGFNVELYHRDGKMKNQLAYAEKKNIPFVWFPPFKDGQPHEVKNMVTGAQNAADATTWQPDTALPEKPACAVC